MTFSTRFCLASFLVCAAASVDAAESEDETTPRSSTAEVSVFGRGVEVGGDTRKFREDYDDLSSGGGLEIRVDDVRDDGVYANAAGSFLFAERGNEIDGAELTIAAGRWGRYHLNAGFSLLQSYFDDSRDGRLGGFPFSNELGRDLHTDRVHLDLEAKALIGERGSLTLRYLHTELDGERSLLKGSIVESLSPFSFRAPSSQDVDRQADAVEIEAILPVGPVQLAIDAAYRDERNQTETRETNFAPTAVRDRVNFSNEFDVDVFQGGATISATGDARVQGHAGYRVVYMEGSGGSVQSSGPAPGDVRRSTDDVEVESWMHLGHAGVVLRPLPHLAARASYAVRDRDRTASASELRMPVVGASSQLVRNRTQKDVMTHSPRVSLSFTGLPRTRLRASYGFDRVSRELDLASLTDSGGLAAIDRIQRTDLDVYTHRARLGARVRLARRATAEVGYHLLREEIDETVDELVNEVTLGDRESDRDRVFAKIRVRASPRASFEFGGEWNRGEFRRTDVEGRSSTDVEGYRVNAQLSSIPLSGLSTHATVSYVDRDFGVGERTDRTLSIFREITFRDRSVAGAGSVSWAVAPGVALRSRYSVAVASGGLDNISHRAHLDAAYRLSELVRLAAGYSYLGFDQDRIADDDFDGHFAWARVALDF